MFALRASAPAPVITSFASAPAVVPPAPAPTTVLTASSQPSAQPTVKQLSHAAPSHQLAAPIKAGQAEDEMQVVAAAQDTPPLQLHAATTAAQETHASATEHDALADKDRQEQVSDQGVVLQQGLTLAAFAEAKKVGDGARPEDPTPKPSVGLSLRASNSQGKLAGRPTVASVPNNPRFAPRPLLQSDTNVEIQKRASQSPDRDVEGRFLSTNLFLIPSSCSSSQAAFDSLRTAA